MSLDWIHTIGQGQYVGKGQGHFIGKCRKNARQIQTLIKCPSI